MNRSCLVDTIMHNDLRAVVHLCLPLLPLNPGSPQAHQIRLHAAQDISSGAAAGSSNRSDSQSSHASQSGSPTGSCEGNGWPPSGTVRERLLTCRRDAGRGTGILWSA